LEEMGRSSALIFPSVAETFGLPMLEARAGQLPIIASERDFVRDVCNPQQTFDPASPHSIARAVLRFMDGERPPAGAFISAEAMAAELMR
ncbi:MAG: glycosyltransferase family 1 protein, partial [Alcaligenaceae bacterium]